MALPATTPISMSREIRVLHLEPTDVCQAACTSCARETDPAFDKNIRHHLTIEQIMQHVAITDIQHLDKMFMCGNYGDPAAGKHTLEIYQWFRDINPGIVLGMNTNGAIQTSTWWQTLGKILQGHQDYVVFSIDGLEDTNHIYRRDVVWRKLIENVRAYISTGANAHWDMLVYRHNEHQIDACQQLAKELGFRWFRTKISRRDLRAELEFPVKWQRTTIKSRDISCHALNEKSAYVDARGNFWPCCWIGSTVDNNVIDIDILQQSWVSPNPHAICVRTCGQTDRLTNFSAQWQQEIQLS